MTLLEKINMTKVTLLIAAYDYEGSSVMAVYSQEEMAKQALEVIDDWHKARPSLPSDDAPDSEWDFYSAYTDTFPFGVNYSADRYYTSVRTLR